MTRAERRNSDGGFISGKQKKARGMTSVGVGSSVWLGPRSELACDIESESGVRPLRDRSSFFAAAGIVHFIAFFRAVGFEDIASGIAARSLSFASQGSGCLTSKMRGHEVVERRGLWQTPPDHHYDHEH
jgi:hypothetical protein